MVRSKPAAGEDSVEQRREALRSNVKERLSGADLTDIKIESNAASGGPLVYAYHIRVPNYAQRSGKRLFLQPAFFEHGLNPMFSDSERTLPIYFHYPWSENDEVMIELPNGFMLDSPDSPAPFAAPPVSEYKPTIGVSKDGKLLVYRRRFFFGAEGNILFSVDKYIPLKTYFDAVNKGDNHTITLKQGAVVTAN